MADFLSPEEIKAEELRLKEAFEAGAITAKQLAEGLNDCRKGVLGFTAEMKAAKDQLGTSMKAMVKGMADGAQGAAQYNDALNAGANVAAKALTQFGPWGAAIGQAIKAVSFFVSAVNDQADALYKANQNIAKTGAMGAGGMTEVFENMQKFGYGIKELGDMSALLNASSGSLARFSGTAFDGARNLANMAKGIKDSGLQTGFMNMGLSVNDINTQLAAYTAQQAALGITESGNVKEMTARAADYITNLSTLSKLTGESADAIAQQRAQANSIDSFFAVVQEQMNGTLEQQQAAEQAYQAYSIVMSRGGQQAAAGFAAQYSGMMGLSKDSMQLSQQTGFASNQLTRQLRQGSIDASQFAQGIGMATTKMQPLTTGLYKIGGGVDTYGKAMTVAGLSSLKNFGTAADKAAKSTSLAMGGYDRNTNAQTQMRQAQMDTRDAFQSLINDGITPVTETMKSLAEIMNNILHPFASKDTTVTAGSGKKTIDNRASARVYGEYEGLGSISAQFESSGANASSISSGKGDKGGKSYGTYQLALNEGSVDKFLDQSGYRAYFVGDAAKVGSPAFDARWRELAVNDQRFRAEQIKYAKAEYYDKELEKLGPLGNILGGKGRAVQEALFSTSVQYGADGASKLIQSALKGKDVNSLSDADIVSSIQDYKAQNVGTNFRSSSQQVQASVATRIQKEKEALLGLAGGAPSNGYQGLSPNDPKATLASNSAGTNTAAPVTSSSMTADDLIKAMLSSQQANERHLAEISRATKKSAQAADN